MKPQEPPLKSKIKNMFLAGFEFTFQLLAESCVISSLGQGFKISALAIPRK